MSELMRAMIGCITITTVVMGTSTFLLRSWLLRRLKNSLRAEFDVELERMRTELRRGILPTSSRFADNCTAKCIGLSGGIV